MATVISVTLAIVGGSILLGVILNACGMNVLSFISSALEALGDIDFDTDWD